MTVELNTLIQVLLQANNYQTTAVITLFLTALIGIFEVYCVQLRLHFQALTVRVLPTKLPQFVTKRSGVLS